MNEAEVRQIAGFLVECQQALWEWDSTDTMTLYLRRLHEVLQRIAAMSPDRGERDLRFGMAFTAKTARRLRRARFLFLRAHDGRLHAH